MTIVKSLKYASETNKETIQKHRTHRSIKNRTVTYGRNLIMDFKRKKEEIDCKDCGEENVK